MKEMKLVDLIDENEGLISVRAFNVLYRTLIIKVAEPMVKDIITYYEFIDFKTKSMKKTHKEIEMLYNYLQSFSK
jgi:hypothetical protein